MDVPLCFLTSREDPEPLRQRIQMDPEAGARELCGWHLATFTLGFLEKNLPSQALAILETGALMELGWTGKRKLALQKLDKFAEENRVSPVLLKGGGTSLWLYEQESERWSSDLDLLLSKEDLHRLYPKETEEFLQAPFAEHHLHRKTVAGTTVEWHWHLEFNQDWGNMDQVASGAEASEEYPHLQIPTKENAFTVCLLHLMKHRGKMPYDLLDAARILRSGSLDMKKLGKLWRDNKLIPFMLATLHFVCSMAEIPAPRELEDLKEAMTAREARRHRFLQRLLFRPEKYSTVDAWRFECLLWGIPLGGFLLFFLIGNWRHTILETGKSPKHPLFWWHHFGTIPAKRLSRLGKRRWNTVRSMDISPCNPRFWGLLLLLPLLRRFRSMGKVEEDFPTPLERE